MSNGDFAAQETLILVMFLFAVKNLTDTLTIAKLLIRLHFLLTKLISSALFRLSLLYFK